MTDRLREAAQDCIAQWDKTGFLDTAVKGYTLMNALRTALQQDELETCCQRAVEAHDEAMSIAKTMNMRKIAQPYLDALIAEIDGLNAEGGYDNFYFDTLRILDKYRTTAKPDSQP